MKINEVGLLCNDLDACQHFYVEVLDLPLLYRTEEELRLQAGSSRLVFYKATAINPVYHLAFTLPDNKLEEAMALLQAHVSILPLPDGRPVAEFEAWDARSFYFKDPCGNILEYIVRFDLQQQDESPFTGHLLISISEVGWVCAHVPQTAASLSTAYGLPYFSKQPPAAQFTVLGDDEGLLILAAEGRPWYPTESTLAALFYTEVLLTNTQGQQLRLINGSR